MNARGRIRLLNRVPGLTAPATPAGQDTQQHVAGASSSPPAPAAACPEPATDGLRDVLTVWQVAALQARVARLEDIIDALREIEAHDGLVTGNGDGR